LIIGTGIDHVRCDRMGDVLSRWGGRFEKRVFDETEISYSRAKKQPQLHFAARFAAKEAFFKALGTGFGRGLNWTDVVVRNRPDGKPELLLKGKARDLAAEKGVRRVHLSLSHTDESGLAIVVMED